jgi:hypothetical protein
MLLCELEIHIPSPAGLTPIHEDGPAFLIGKGLRPPGLSRRWVKTLAVADPYAEQHCQAALVLVRENRVDDIVEGLWGSSIAFVVVQADDTALKGRKVAPIRPDLERLHCLHITVA